MKLKILASLAAGLAAACAAGVPATTGNATIKASWKEDE